MSESIVELTPGAGQMIASLTGKNGMTVTAAFCELIDNCFDAGAKHVDICYKRRRGWLQVKDDGNGTNDVRPIVTPFLHRDHPTTESGRYGIGGTSSIIWLTQGLGTVSVGSATKSHVSRIIVDYKAIRQTNRMDAKLSRESNEGIPHGTEIEMTGCMEITSNHVGSIKRELSFTFAPALRKGSIVTFDVDGKRQAWDAYHHPTLTKNVPISIEVDGHAIKGFCGLVKPGEPNGVKGWAVAFGHRFLGRFSNPIGDRSVDLGRIYSEITLPKTWKNINDHKNNFITDPDELWEKLSEACSGVMDQAEQEGHSIELDASIRAAQDLLDHITEYEHPSIKGRRPGNPGAEGSEKPTGSGSLHRKFRYTQPGDKPGRQSNCPSPNRIKLDWVSGMLESYELRVEGRSIRLLLNPDHPDMKKYRGADSGPFLVDLSLLIVAADSASRPDSYKALMPDIESGRICEKFDSMRSRLRRDPLSSNVA